MKKLLIYLFGTFLLFIGCEDKKKASGNTTQTEIAPPSHSGIHQEIKLDKNDTISNPVLTNKNAVSFLTNYGKENPETKVLISTSLGDIEIELFKDTPLHRANFIYLLKQGYFDETFFHRVVPDFIIQGGNSDLISTPKKRTELGNDYLLPAEIIPGRNHEYGTVSGAKEYRENPDNRSAPFEFFIFLGPKSSTAHLNGKYTIFGKVAKGMDVVKEISELDADGEDWPLANIYIKAKVLE